MFQIPDHEQGSGSGIWNIVQAGFGSRSRGTADPTTPLTADPQPTPCGLAKVWPKNIVYTIPHQPLDIPAPSGMVNQALPGPKHDRSPKPDTDSMTASRPITNTAARLVPTGPQPLTEEDLSALEMLGPAEAPGVTKLRIRHHAMARMLAMGAKQQEVQELFGGQISVLLRAPAFRSLVEEYLKDLGDLQDLRRRVVGTATEGVMLMHQKLLEAADDPKVGLGKIQEATFGLLDRAGVGPNKTSHHTYGPSAELLEAIKSEADSGTVVDLQAGDWTVVGRDDLGGAVAEAQDQLHDPGAGGGDPVSAPGGEAPPEP